MGHRATIAFCGHDGTEWARIYIHNRGDNGRQVLEQFFDDEAAAIADGTRDSRWHDPSYLAARFVAWDSRSAGLGVGIVYENMEERWHWQVTCYQERPSEPADWPPVVQISPAPIDTTNDYGFGKLGIEVDGINIAPMMPVGAMDRAKALRTAAWLSLIADPGGEEFAAVLDAIKAGR